MDKLLKIQLLTIFLILCSYSLQSRGYNNEYLEHIVETLSPETETAPQVDLIEQLAENPFDLTTADVSDILIIPGFTYSLSLRITDFIMSHKEFSYDMIADSLNMSEEHDYLLRLCTYISQPYEYAGKKNVYVRIRNEQNLNEMKGFRDSSFLGDRLNLYQRYTAYYNNFSVGAIMTKDAGEISITDFYSGYITGTVAGTKFIIGDYSIQNGMGSILKSGLNIGKGADVISPAVEFCSDILPYRSSMESRFMRGAAVRSTWDAGRHRKLSTSFFVSYNNRAATIDTLSGVITSLYSSDLFRTETETGKKGKALERLAGGSLEWAQTHITSGLAAYYMNYDRPVHSSSSTALEGSSGILSSFYTVLSFGSTTLGVELCRDATGHAGIKSGLNFGSDNYEAALHYRSFPAGFRSPFGYNFGKSGIPSNETGLYGAFTWKKHRKFNISAYFDLYKTYTRTYLVPMPERGLELFTEAAWFLNDKLKLSGRTDYKNSSETYTDESGKKSVYQKGRYSLRLELNHTISAGTYIRMRAESCFIDFDSNKPNENGVSAFAEFSWQAFSTLRLSGRFTYFNTPSFESAMWQYEPALPGYMTIAPLYGNGTRIYISASYSLLDFISISARYAVTSKNYVKTMGTGLNEINGNSDQRLLVQMDIAI